MNATIMTAALAALVLAGPVRADDKPAAPPVIKPAPSATDSVMSWFKKLKTDLTQSAVSGERKHSHGVGSVAAVRGKRQASDIGDPNEPTLKGSSSSKKEQQSVAEDGEFEQAVSLIVAGKVDDGVKALEAFKVKYPKSANLELVQKAIEQSKSLPAQKPADVKSDSAAAKPSDGGAGAGVPAVAPKADATGK